MIKQVCFVLSMALFCAVVYLLYCRGIVVSKCITAVLFVFRAGKDSDRASLDSCTGWVGHAGRFRGCGRYEFTLDAPLSKGDAEVFLLDRNGRQLLKLNRELPVGRIELDGESRYYLRWEFKNTSGKCELHWSNTH